MSDLKQLPEDKTYTTWLEQSKQNLREFFQQRSVKNLVSVLVPGTLAAVLLPIFGPVAAGTAAAVAIRNTLVLFKIDMSTETIEKLLKPIEGKQLDEDEMRQTLTDTLQNLLPTDQKVNDEAAKALILLTPSVKEAALSNPRLNAEWLGTSLEANLKEQGEMMERIAPDVHTLILKDDKALNEDVQHLLQDWSRIAVEIMATNESTVKGVESKARVAGGQIGHRVAADNKSSIQDIKLDSEIS